MSKRRPGYTSYVIGFVLALLLTLAAYVLVVTHTLTSTALISALVGLAMLQLGVQLVCFIRLDREDKPRWRLMSFLFMSLVLLIIVVGSLWIMNNLNYHMLMGHESDESIMHDEGITH